MECEGCRISSFEPQTWPAKTVQITVVPIDTDASGAVFRVIPGLNALDDCEDLDGLDGLGDLGDLDFFM